MDDGRFPKLQQLWLRLRSPEGLIGTILFLWSVVTKGLDMIGELQTSATLWPWIKDAAFWLYHASASSGINALIMVGGIGLMWHSVHRAASSDLIPPSELAKMLHGKMLKTGAMVAHCPIHADSTIAYSGVKIQFMCWTNKPFEVNRDCSLDAAVKAVNRRT